MKQTPDSPNNREALVKRLEQLVSQMKEKDEKTRKKGIITEYKDFVSKLENPAKESNAAITIDDLAAEGELLLKEDTKNPPAAVKKENPKNIYIVAREKVLKKYPEWRKKEILTMESKNDKDNRHYAFFVQEVMELAEKTN
jgi:hypothetical protein